MGRGAHDVLVRLGELAAAVILVCAFALWRLMQGPIELDSLVPYVQQAFDRSGLPLHLAISGVRFGLDRETHQLDLWVEGVRVALPSGEAIANFPEMATSFSPGSLLRGVLAPTRLVVERPVLRLVRDETGAIRLRVGEQDGTAPGFGPELLDQLTGPLQQDRNFGLLRHVMVRDATLILDDRRTGRNWQASHVDAALYRDPEGLDGDLSFAVAMGASGNAELHVNYRYAPASQRLDLRVSVDGLDPARLTALSPELEPLSIAHFPVSGTVRTRFDLAQGRSEGVRLDMGFGKGWVQSELLPEGALPLEQGELHAVYAPELARLRLDTLALDLGGGSRLSLDGNVDGITPDMVLGAAPLPAELAGRLGVVLSDVPVAKFETLWPRALSRGGRRWVLANIHDGALDEAAMQLDLTIDTAALNANVVGAHGSMRYHDLTIDYFKGLPPVRKVSGVATLSDKRLDFTPTGGAVKSVQVTGGSLQITDLGARTEWLTIDLSLAGPLQDVLEVVNSKPLRYAHDVGVDPATIGGHSETNLHFKLPLLDALTFDAVEYGAKATLTGASVGNIALNRGLSDGDLSLEIARGGAHLQGNGRFDGIATTIDANVFFKPKDPVRARYRVALTATDADRRRLGFDFLPDRVAGPVRVDLTYSSLAGGRAEAEIALDLRGCALTIDEAGWKKPPDAPGNVKLSMQLENDQIVRLSQIAVNAAGLDGRLSIAFAADHKTIDRVDIRRLVIGGDDLRGIIARRPGGGWRAELRGARFDLSDVIKKATKAEPDASAPPLVVDAQFGEVVLGQGRSLRGLSAQLMRAGTEWQSARVDGRFPNGHQLTLRFGPESGHRLIFLSDDLGATLNLLDIADNVVGGHIAIRGELSESGGKPVLRAHVEGEDYNLVRAPGVARVLSLASLTAIGSMLAGTGIPFTTLRGDFVYSEDRLAFDRVVAYGGAIGVTANGSFDLGHDRLDVQGTVVPAYTLNSIIGNVPVIGALLLGGEGQGLFAANFRLTGSGADPEVSVNPLSVLAPGFLRRLFQPNFGAAPALEAPANPQQAGIPAAR